MLTLRHVPKSEFDRVLAASLPPARKAALFAALCRLNVLYMIKRAGSGHIGTSFSCADLVSWIFLEEATGADDVFFSSKGHDVPMFYAALTALGRIPFEQIHALRRLGGLPGHPEVHIPHMQTNSGSLGMGISKGKGMLLARRFQGKPARAFVLTGDGELNEGQIWESLSGAVTRKMGDLTVVVDHNKIQSDTWVHKVNDLGDLAAKFRAFGWHVERCNGNDVPVFSQVLARLRDITDRPKVVIADTVKGRGVSFMEAFGPEEKFYGFHAGAPGDEQYTKGLEELTATATRLFAEAGLGAPALESFAHDVPPPSPQPRAKLVEAYGRTLVQQAQGNDQVVVLDADLIKDTGLAEFAARFPERLVECGIAEQDMVSQAGGLALKGMLPIVHSFSCFLSARPNEQIYTNATERSKIIYVATLAGLLPATPGHSHQSVRDVSSLGAMPNLVLLAPATEQEVTAALDWAIHRSPESTYLRLSSIPCVLPFTPVEAPALTPGQGTVLREGKDAVVFAYGPVMTSQAVLAAEAVAGTGSVKVIGLPWLNRIDPAWLARTVAGARWLCTIDDAYLHGGQGDMLISALACAGWPAGLRVKKLGLPDVPACGQNDEVLRHHGLDAAALTEIFRTGLVQTT